MNGYFIFNHRRSDEVGLRVSGYSTFDAPQRVFESVTVPGRNGTLHIDGGRFENITVSYEASLVRDFSISSAALREWLLSLSGYCKLEDSYHPDTFRLARFSGGVSFTGFTQLCRAAKVNLRFDCKPQRFLKLGEVPILRPASIFNPTAFPAKPLIQFTMSAASGSLTIGDCAIAISGATAGDTFIIDAETTDAIGADGSNKNRFVAISGEITLQADAETVITSTGISDLQITPRWWTI